MSQNTHPETNNQTNISLGKDLSQTDAIKVLIRAAQVGQEKGAYSLQEASLIHNAVATFMINPNEKKNEVDDTNTSDSSSSINNVNEVNEK
jgi:hypothetical protein